MEPHTKDSTVNTVDPRGAETQSEVFDLYHRLTMHTEAVEKF